MSVNILYQTAARATGGRDGRFATLDGTFDCSRGGMGADMNLPRQHFTRLTAGC